LRSQRTRSGQQASQRLDEERLAVHDEDAWAHGHLAALDALSRHD
jgi:hypothetical protein